MPPSLWPLVGAALLPATGILLFPPAALALGPAPLHFDRDGNFQIAIFSDLHFGEAEDTLWGPQQDADTLGVMRAVLGAEAPVQLVVLNGDLVTGENTFVENATLYLDVLVRPIVEAKVPFASAYGNHDNDYNISSRSMYSREKDLYNNSLTGNAVNGDNSGVSNYYLPVYATEQAEVPALILWFFDTRGGKNYRQLGPDGKRIGRPNWVDSSVVTWFEQTRDALTTSNGGTPIPSLAFFHIPTNASLALQTAGLDPHKQPGINDDAPLAQQGVATGEGPTGMDFVYEGQDVPFMKALVETEGLIAAFSGHDHGNDWCARWEGRVGGMALEGNGLFLCFSRHTGHGGYGSWIRGSRQVLLSLDSLGDATETWHRFEDGSVAGKVTLNSTYGEDIYEAVPLIYSRDVKRKKGYSN